MGQGGLRGAELRGEGGQAAGLQGLQGGGEVLQAVCASELGQPGVWLPRGGFGSCHISPRDRGKNQAEPRHLTPGYRHSAHTVPMKKIQPQVGSASTHQVPKPEASGE